MAGENEQTKTNKVSETINAVTGLVKSVPVYSDTLQPAAKEFGKSLELVAKTVNTALTTLKLFIWSFDKLQSFIDNKVSEKLQNTSEEDIQTPKSNIAVPVMQSLMYSGDEPELQDMFANLLAASMDKQTSSFAHPSFVEAIRQMTPDEARLIRYFWTEPKQPLITIRYESKEGTGGVDIARHLSLAGEKANCDNSVLTQIAIDNLCRLGLINIPHNYGYTDKTVYSDLKNHEDVKV